ncbi:hypothetical protein HPP92_022727 [Vanilla planifolia]|uniref:Aspartokinase n=1 Tax=Vanilla planifolia TaxID=51239 RepID=A0A835PXY7_VANPL|nr:hypothetical protein HPP92_022727 [Vanilla planifolia]
MVMRFDASSIATSERMKEVADIILSYADEKPVIVLSAMGKTTSKLLQVGNKAERCSASNVCEIEEWKFIKDLHLKTINELGIDEEIISGVLDELKKLFEGIAMGKELTDCSKDYLMSFGECMSTRIFAAYLTKTGTKARQYDAVDIGFINTDDFTNTNIFEASYPSVAERLLEDCLKEPAIPVVNNILGKFWSSRATTTLERCASDLTATLIAKALGLREIQIWMDTDGVLTCDPNIHPHAVTVPSLTFEEAIELAYSGSQVLHPQSMQLASEADISVMVKNSNNPTAAGTLITKGREMNEIVLTSIVLKSNITMLSIVSTRTLGQYDFLAKVFSIIEEFGISVGCISITHVSICVTLAPFKPGNREPIPQEMDHVVEELEKFAAVHLLRERSVISLIGNLQHSSLILEKAFNVLCEEGINAQMTSQGASKVKISFVVHDSEAQTCVGALHAAFFENTDGHL